MNKTLMLVSVLIVAAACAAPPTNQPALDTNRNTNLAAETAPMSEADAIAREKASWEAIKQKDYTGFANMLADDQLEVLSDGVTGKAETLEGVKQFEPSEVNLSDWKFLPIGKDGFIVAYTAAVKGKFKGQEFPPILARCSSAWMRRNNKWLAVYHQECPVKPPMPPPPASTSPAKPAPESKPEMAAAGPDPIANEKMVWDLFKSKSYDAFAAMLASDFLQVTPDNFYDKAGSVKGVSMFDASKAVLSDWKSVKLDDSSSLVTYTVKDAVWAPKGERHSSIYLNREGKWLALFHHGGTPVETPSAANTAKPAPSAATK